MMTPNEFRDARSQLGLSLAEMARAIGLADRQQIRKYELSPDQTGHKPVNAWAERVVWVLLTLSDQQRKRFYEEFQVRIKRGRR